MLLSGRQRSHDDMCLGSLALLSSEAFPFHIGTMVYCEGQEGGSSSCPKMETIAQDT
jgi:hypothetical protein